MVGGDRAAMGRGRSRSDSVTTSFAARPPGAKADPLPAFLIPMPALLTLGTIPPGRWVAPVPVVMTPRAIPRGRVGAADPTPISMPPWTAARSPRRRPAV